MHVVLYCGCKTVVAVRVNAPAGRAVDTRLQARWRPRLGRSYWSQTASSSMCFDFLWSDPRMHACVTRPHHSTGQVNSIATDWVVWSVCWSVCHDRKHCKNGRTDRDAIWNVDSGGPKEPCIRSRFPHMKGNFKGQKRPAQTRLVVNILKENQQATEMVWCGYQWGCTTWGAQWRHLANITEPSECGRDVGLCQTSLTGCC